MILPFVIWLVIFRYLPLWGWITAFQNYKPGVPLFQQQWVGLKYFKEMFSDPEFYLVMRNTLAMSLLGLIFGFPLPIFLALLVNEIRNESFKRTVQTISYLPHFVSWVIVASIVHAMLAPDGVINYLLIQIGLIEEPILFLGEPRYFWWIVVFADLWKELGWNTIIYLAAIADVNPALYEAAEIDGAGRFKKMRYITLPCIMPVVTVILILSIGNIINIGYERQFLLRTPAVREVSEVIDLYALDYGIRAGRFSFGTAASMFKSVVSLILVFSANRLSKRVSDYRIF
ncbi:MAG TPA: ABC transporter permease subunit [Candidatus Atribacteria bacterium]|nr:ABC transporter permease subunit [Candidatus Atribacteria bacterium]